MEDKEDRRIRAVIDELVEEKQKLNYYMLEFKFYEVRVTHSIKKEQENRFLELAKIKLNNMGYKVYFENEIFTYNGVNMKVKQSDLLIAIKEKQ